MFKIQPKKTRFIVVGILLAIVIVILITNFAKDTPDNPIAKEKQENLLLEDALMNQGLSTTTDSNDAKSDEKLDLSNKESNSNVEEDSINTRPTKEKTDSVDQQDDTNETKTTKEKGNTDSSKGNPTDTKTIKLVNNYDDEPSDANQGYFTTNINDGDIFYQRELKLVITQLNHALKVENLVVYLNDTKVQNFQGKLYLNIGSNTISIAVAYRTADNKLLIVQRNYTVTVKLSDIKISCDLVDNITMNQPTLFFHATATYKEKQIPVVIYCNNKILEEDTSGFLCTLKPGTNEIIINAQADGNSEERTYRINYDAPDEKYVIDTDLYNHKAELPNVTFYAKAYIDKKEVKTLLVTFNDKKISGKDGKFEVVLINGINYITLSVGDGDKNIQQTYSITYAAKVVDNGPIDGEGEGAPVNPGGNEEEPTEGENPKEEEPVDDHAPILYTDLVNESTITGTTLSFNTMPVDYKGKRIRASGVLVNCNGQTITHVWDDSTKTSYRMDLVNGENSIRITVTDMEGNSLTFPFTIYCKNVDVGGSLGYVTISVEATTIGQGYLIPPTQVEIFQGVNAATMLTELLSQYGYSYKSTGSIATGFYLSHIMGPGIVSNPFVNPELEQHLLETEGAEYDINKYNSNSLGEFDFSTGSGWMYSVNGDYPNYGFSDCYPHDGDVIRIRYTLYLGKDIMGGYAMGDGDVANWGDY